MRVGAHHSGEAYAWPDTLVHPKPGSRIVYLDLNHWINLAKAAKGHSDGERFLPVLEAMRRARSRPGLIVPLSAEHYMEMAGIGRTSWRADLADIMEELSGFQTLITRVVVLKAEVEAALVRFAGPRDTPLASVPLINFGVGPAFGKRGGLRITDKDGNDASQKMRSDYNEGPDAFDRRLAELNWEAERRLLRGPDDSEVPSLRRLGWDPTVARRISEERATEERAQAARFSNAPTWRRGRIRDVISARYVAIQILEPLEDGLERRRLRLEDVFCEPSQVRALVDAMPSADAFVSLVTAAHRNPTTQWSGRTIFDVDALSYAVAYCDIVVTERHFGNLLRVEGVAERLGTRVITSLEELEHLL